MAFDIMPIIIFIFTSSILVVISTFGLYGLFLLIYARKNETLPEKSIEIVTPTISIILPTFNEGSFIRKKIDNLLETDYNKKKIEIIIVDDSTNKSSEDYISKIANDNPNIHVNRSEKRRGYSRALLDGFQVATGEIIILTDTGSLYEPKTIPELIQPFRDPKIGGVTGAANIINKNERTGKSESFYRRIYNFMRESESNADSTFHFHGEVSAVRKELLKDLRSFPTNQDIAIAFHVRKQGYKVVLNSNAKFNEYAPKRLEERHKQKAMRATGVILVILGYKGMFSPKYGLFGTIIYPAHFSMMIICPLSILSGSFSFLLLLGATPNLGLIILFSFLILFAFIFIIKKELITNFFQLEIALLQAIWRVFTRRSQILYIEKIDSTRRGEG